MEQNTAIYPNITDSLDDLLILNFWKIIENGNYLMLYSDYTKKKEYTAEEQKHANSVWLQLYDEYYEQCKDSKSHNELNKDNKEQRLHLRIQVLITLINTIGTLQDGRDLVDDDVYAEMINEAVETIYRAEPSLKGKINVFDSATQIADSCKKLLKSLEGQYKRLIDDKPTLAKDYVKKAINHYERSAALTENMGTYIPIERMCVNEWIGFENRIKQKIKASKKNGK